MMCKCRFFLLFFLVVINSRRYVGLQQVDSLSKMSRIFISCGMVFEPTVFLNRSNFENKICSNFLGGGKFSLDFFSTEFYKKKRCAFSKKHKIFYVKLRNIDIYKTKKCEFKNYILGYQFNFGPTIILNRKFRHIIFDHNNKINQNVYTLDCLFGLKFEWSSTTSITNANLVYPTKILAEILYKIDFKNGFSFFIGITINRCFSPVYLFSFNKEDLKKVFNPDNNFAWNIDINIGFIGFNFPL